MFKFLQLILLLCVSAVIQAQDYEDGRKAYIEGNYQAAFEILAPLAEAGDSEAQKILGVMYDYGQGVEKDKDMALHWYLLSAEQGQPAVQYQVGAKYFRGDGIDKDLPEAAKWWELAANGGQVDAQFNLGLMYYRGLSVEKDNLRAAELFEQAASQGHSYAQYSLAVMYSFGQGVEKSHDTAFLWFSRSAEQGIAQAQYNMGVYYENGYSTNKDLEIARYWYERASAQELDEATDKLSLMESLPQSSDPKPDMLDPTEYSLAEISTDSDPIIAEPESIPEPIPETTPALAMSADPGSIRRKTWLMQQSPDTYTLQISSVVNEQDLINYIQRHNIESDTAYIEVVINGVTRYNAFYGLYDNYDDATLAAEQLPDRIRNVKPWIRNISVLQKLIH